jgi:hypothetical protein
MSRPLKREDFSTRAASSPEMVTISCLVRIKRRGGGSFSNGVVGDVNLDEQLTVRDMLAGILSASPVGAMSALGLTEIIVTVKKREDGLAIRATE